jgi:hypothetical protein
MDEDVAVWIVRCGDELELPAIEGMGRIGHFKAIVGAIRVVDGGINIGYRSMAFRTPSL